MLVKDFGSNLRPKYRLLDIAIRRIGASCICVIHLEMPRSIL